MHPPSHWPRARLALRCKAVGFQRRDDDNQIQPTHGHPGSSVDRGLDSLVSPMTSTSLSIRQLDASGRYR